MRQGLIQLSLLGLVFGLETVIPPGPGFSQGREGLHFLEKMLFVLLCLTLLISILQRIALISRTSHPKEIMSKILTTPHAPFLLLHVGLLLLILAFAYAKTGAIEALMELPVGGEGRTVSLDDGRKFDLPFTVRATGFEMERYPSGEVRQFVGKLELIAGGGNIKKKEITVGEPLMHGGYRFSLFQYGDRGTRIKGSIRKITDPSTVESYDALTGSSVSMPDDSFAALVSLEEHATRRTSSGYRDVGHAVHYKMQGRNGKRYDVVSYQSATHVIDWRLVGTDEYTSIHLLRNPEAARNLPMDYYLTVSDISAKKTVGFQVRSYRGLYLLLFASILVVLGTTWEVLVWRPAVEHSALKSARMKPPKAFDQRAKIVKRPTLAASSRRRQAGERPCST